MPTATGYTDSSNGKLATAGAVKSAYDTLNTNLEGISNPTFDSPTFFNIPNKVCAGRKTFTGTSTAPLPTGATSGSALYNYFRFGSGSGTTNSRHATLVVDNSGVPYVKNKA
jgi:hypothetical protein